MLLYSTETPNSRLLGRSVIKQLYLLLSLITNNTNLIKSMGGVIVMLLGPNPGPWMNNMESDEMNLRPTNHLGR